jgi:hypothetical protein
MRHRSQRGTDADREASSHTRLSQVHGGSLAMVRGVRRCQQTHSSSAL